MVARSKLGRWRVGYTGTSCPRCKAALPHESLKDGTQTCPSCRGGFEAVRFDPVQPLIVVPSLAGVGPEAGAPCAQHARNQAEAACSRCGQFMCALCKIDAEGKAYCPPCYERLMNEGSVPGGATRMKFYAGYATLCFFSCFLFWFLGPLPGALGIFFAIKGIQDKKSRNEQDGVAILYLLLVACAFGILLGVGMLLGMLGGFARMAHQ